MPLELDPRQRAMLQEMGVHVWLPDSGVAVLERPSVSLAPSPRATVPNPLPVAPTRSPQPAPLAPAARAPAPTHTAATALQVGQDSSPDWQALSASVQSCQACTLCAGRSHTTLVAPVSATVACDWMILGDPPDEDEDRAAGAFAGPDGALLANMLRALGLQRANPLPGHTNVAKVDSANPAATPARRAYVSNVLKCRPAHGAIAQAAELSACSAWLQREIALVQPKVILSMGRFANQLLLGETPALAALPLGKLRGTVHRYQGLAVVVSYPPKLLMRNSADKAKAWADLCLAASTLDSAT